MARLVFRIGNAPKVMYLGDQPVGIGRRPDNQIVLDDIAASGRHCWVSLASGAYWVEDLKSSNGTLLNGQKVSMARLKNGDVITIGRIQIGYFEEESSEDLSGTVRMPAFKAEAAPAASRAAAAPPPPSQLAALSRTASGGAPARPVAPPPPAATRPPPPPAAAPLPVAPVRAPVPPAAPAPVAPSFSDEDLTPLGSASPSPRKFVLESAPIEGARFIIPGEDKPPAATQQAPASGVGSQGPGAKPSDPDMLDHLVGSIRSHRDREQRDREESELRLRAEWEKALTYSEQLKLKLGTDPRIKFFGVNRRANDVMIRFQRHPGEPIRFMMLSLNHPENKHESLHGIWFRCSGESDRCFQTADDLAAEMIREFAFVLA